MDVPFFDPLLIIKKTNGRMAGDHQWVQSAIPLRKEGAMEMIDLSKFKPQETLNHTSKES